jgi:ABC-type multidrug transport system fused ATPase/permease subunit
MAFAHPARGRIRHDPFEPLPFAKRLARRYWPLLSVILLSMGAYSSSIALRTGTIGLLGDVTMFQVKVWQAKKENRQLPGVDQQGLILRKFEDLWRTWIGGEPATARLDEPRRFFAFLGILAAAAALLALAMGAAFFLKEILAQKLVLRIIADIRQAIVDHLVFQSLSFYHRRKARTSLRSRTTMPRTPP